MGNMLRTDDLLFILNKEIELYGRMLALEEQKTDVIIERRGRTLDNICSAQEEIISELMIYEKARQDEIDRFRLMEIPHRANRDITLRDVAAQAESRNGEILMNAGRELKRTVTRFDRLRKNNRVLIEDNMEYFQIMIRGMKNHNTVLSGYDKLGREKGKIAGPVLFNQTA